MKMKKISKLISLSVIMCLLISSLCVLNVSASDTEPTLLFDLDMSGFEKGQENESWGLTGSGDDADTTVIMAREGHIKDSKTATGSTTLKTFVNVKDEEVSYINQGLANSGNSGRSGTTENSRIHIENEDWNDKATTMEIWVNQKSKASGGAYLNFYVDDADSDRVTYDYNIPDDGDDNDGDNTGDDSGDDNGDDSGDVVIEDNLLFDLDFSGFDKTIETTWGLKNKVPEGDEVTITARDGYNSTYNLVTGVSTKESFKDPNGNTVDYIYQEPWNIGASSRSQSTENTRIIIENKEWATKATTTEIWAYKYQNNNNNRFLNFFRDADTTDRSAFDKIIYVNRNASSQEVLVYRNGSTNVESKKTSITKSGDYNWYLFTLVATPVDTDSDNVADSMKYELQIDDKRSATLVVTVPMSDDEIYGIVLGSTTNGCYYAPKQFGVASVKVYDGALTTEEVTAHYNAQKASFTNISMKNPEFSSVTPEAGSSLLSNEGEFTVKFTTGGTATYIDEASLEKGIVLRDAEGNEIPSVKTLESGKKTVTVKADNLPEGQITLSVTTKLLSTNGKSIKTQVDKTYTVTAP